MGNFSNYWDLHTLFTKIKNKIKSVSDKIDDSVSLKTATGNPIVLTGAANANAEELLMTIEPIQDLHGYSKPWPAGGGKNLLPMTMDGIKSANTSGTWSGNTYILNGVTYTFNTDTDGNVTGITANGTASQSAILNLATYSANSGDILNGISSNPNREYYLYARGGGTASYSGDVNILPADIGVSRVYAFVVLTSSTVSNLTVYPMIRLATETDPTFEPYSNICPISGISEAVVTRTGKNLVFDEIIGYAINSSGGLTQSIESIICIAQVAEGNTYTITNRDNFGQYVYAFYLEKPTVSTEGSYNGTRTVVYNNPTFTAPITGYVAFRSYVVSESEGFQLELGTIATAYEAPVTPATATISLGQTVYGGSVNFKTGEVTVTHGMVDLGTLTWIYGWGGHYSDTLTDIKTGLCELICSGLSFYPKSFRWGDIATIPDHSVAKNANDKYLYVKDTRYTDATAFKTAMSGVQLCYELATPTTLTLTPAELELLKGNNTITANGAEISLSYYPDNAIGALAKRVDNLDNTTSNMQTQLDSKVEEVSVTITVTQGSGEARANEIISGVLNANVLKIGTNIIAVNYASVYRALLIYSGVSNNPNNYGRGVLVDYYDNGTYEFENVNRTITIGTVLTDKSDVIAGLTANNILTGINISAYNSASNQYTAPTDGYVRMELRNENQHFYLYANNITLLGGEGHQVANANEYMTIFVRKGMKLYYDGTVQTAMFYSLT